MNILEILDSGSLEILGQFTWGSNSTFLVRVDNNIEAVYKPVRGEQPLWDFPSESLAGREVAAYLLSEALGWGLVPPTVLRADAPYGPGSLQLRIQHNPEQHYFTFDEETRQRLRPAAIFDLIANNADRKGGHILLDPAGKIWLIDHGICFHAEPKLRTVIWDFAAEPISADLLADLAKLGNQLAPDSQLTLELAKYLNEEELAALSARIPSLLADPIFPVPSEEQRQVPWPLV